MEQIDFKKQIDYLRDTGYSGLPTQAKIHIPEARVHLQNGLKYFCGENAKWLSEYDSIVEWMEDNKGRGLLLMGSCGVGKTLIGMRILPLLINYYCRKNVSIYTAQELNSKPDEIISKHIVYVDDVGTEDISNIYGNKRIPFAELVDAAERNGKLLIATTNLDKTHLTEKYKDRVMDRLEAITKGITIKGNSMRLRK